MSVRHGELVAWLAITVAFVASVIYRLAYVQPPHPYPVTVGVLAGVVALVGVLWALAGFITNDDDEDSRYEQEILRGMARNVSKGDPT